ncbi:hypothetical protein [Nitrosomonas sp. Nm33]|uniref:hypothetical protein n=1 Tax=Nitrosomonas sp. Nm33 TaxID=133724 RepID=UPI00089D2814|nr:hypothetical protein [Nitrosomonas sp. Nm33]SDY59401.1 hypothetical protein SAMN05421755_103212 [Nitrosomonas sp. Nm33]
MKKGYIIVIGAFLVSGAGIPAVAEEENNSPRKQTVGDLACSVDEMVNWDGVSWVCASDRASIDSDNLVLIDSDPTGSKPVGRVLTCQGMNDHRVSVAISIKGMNGNNYQFPVNISTNQIDPHGRTYFTSLDCSGEFYIENHLNSMEESDCMQNTDPYSVALLEDGRVQLIVPVAGTETTIVAGSMYNGYSCEQLAHFNMPHKVIKGIIAVDDLHAEFIPPFTLIANDATKSLARITH